MKKIDYSILAALIARETARYAANRERADNPVAFARHDEGFKALETLAWDFANRASVEREKFIKECGV